MTSHVNGGTRGRGDGRGLGLISSVIALRKNGGVACETACETAGLDYVTQRSAEL